MKVVEHQHKRCGQRFEIVAQATGKSRQRRWLPDVEVVKRVNAGIGTHRPRSGDQVVDENNQVTVFGVE